MINVILDENLYIKRASVTSYPHQRGRQVRSRQFTGQFKGKGPNDPIQIGADIDAITAATLSSRVMTDGIGDIVKMLKTQAKQAQP
ncbi:MAG: FMN-binding protein [Planctomycetes bacterium]|nr:FMN-binding protein [Planctomycetota bacterium]